MDRLIRRVIAFVALVAFTGFPVTAGVCAATCAPADRAASTGRAADCHDAQAAHVRLEPQSVHDCGNHDAAARDANATLTPARPDRLVVAFVTASAFGWTTHRLSPVAAATAYRSPPGARTSRTTLVLRV